MTIFARTQDGLSAALLDVGGDWSRLWFDGDRIVTVSPPVVVSVPGTGSPSENVVNDLVAAIAAIGTAQSEITLSGSITISAALTVPANISLRVPKGVVITINSGITLRINGPFAAGNYVVFAGAGTVDFNEGSRHHNLAWYAGNSINEKWDFARRGLLNIWPYTAYIPHPSENDPAATYSVRDGRKMWFWKLTAPMYFDDAENRGEWTVDGHIQAQVVMPSMLHFSVSGKTEDINFRTNVLLDGANKAAAGVYVNGCARLRWHEQLYVINCGISLHCKAGLPLSSLSIKDFYSGQNSIAAAVIEADVEPITGVKIGSLIMNSAANLNCYGVKYIGDVRHCRLEDFEYGGNGTDLLVGVYVEANAAQGATKAGLFVGGIHGEKMITGFMTRLTSGGTRMYNITVAGPIVPAPDVTSGVIAVDVQYLADSTISNTGYSFPVVLDWNTVRVKLETPAFNGVVDHGAYNIINGLIRVAAGVGAYPDMSLTRTGDKVLNTSDGTVWIKKSDSGDPAIDFLRIA